MLYVNFISIGKNGPGNVNALISSITTAESRHMILFWAIIYRQVWRVDKGKRVLRKSLMREIRSGWCHSSPLLPTNTCLHSSYLEQCLNLQLWQNSTDENKKDNRITEIPTHSSINLLEPIIWKLLALCINGIISILNYCKIFCYIQLNLSQADKMTDINITFQGNKNFSL